MSKPRQRPLKGQRRDGYVAAKVRIHREILKALGYQCNRCGREGQWPVVVLHHKDRNRANNAAENLEALCTACHAREHIADKLPALRRGMAKARAHPNWIAGVTSEAVRVKRRALVLNRCDECKCGRRKLTRSGECALCAQNRRRRDARRSATHSAQLALWPDAPARPK